MESLGKHILLDLYDCSNVDKAWDEIREIFSNGLLLGNFTVITDHYHEFKPCGLSGVFVLAESHCSFHIWVELNFISLDVYWCGHSCNEQILVNTLVNYFEPERVNFEYVERGYF